MNNILILALTLSVSPPAPAQNANRLSPPTALEQVRLELAEDAPLVTILLRDGRISAVLENKPTPAGFHIIDGEGALALPAFVDASSDSGCEMGEAPEDVDRPLDPRQGVLADMRRANRKGLRPAFRAADVLSLPDDGAAWRSSGFGSVLVCPHGELLSGTSCLVVPREAAPRDTVVREGPFQHAAFQATGSGYPSTLMGYHSQLRQFFEDSRHQGVLLERRASGRSGPRPPLDRDLDAGLELLAGGRLMCDAQTSRDILRWIRLADEYGVSIAIRGGNEAWRVASTLAERGIPVILTLDWGEEVEDPLAEEDSEDESASVGDEPEGDTPDGEASEGDVPDDQASGGDTSQAEDSDEEAAAGEEEEDSDQWIYHEPQTLAVERRRLWLEKRDCALRLAEAGVPFAFGTGGEQPSELLENVRTLVNEGLEREVALSALTRGAALILAAPQGSGTLGVGAPAHVALWESDPLGEEKSELRWIVLDGFPSEQAGDEAGDGDPPDEGLDATGAWELEFADEEARPATAEIVMDEDGSLTADCLLTSPEGQPFPMELEGRVSGSSLRLKGKAEPMEGFVIEVSLRGTLEEEAFSGQARWKGPGFDESTGFTANRKPDQTGGRR